MNRHTQKKTDRYNEPAVFWAKIQSFSETVSDYIICIYLILMLAVFPLYSREGYAHIGTDKAFFFCRVSTCTGMLLVIPLGLRLTAEVAGFLYNKIVRSKTQCVFGAWASNLQRSKLNVPFWTHNRKESVAWPELFALLYGGAVLISYGCSKYRESGFWGAQGWYMGLVPQLMMILICLLTSRLWKPRSWMALPMLVISAIVFLLGCLNRFGVYPIEMSYASPSFISTIGNINWFCGYAVTTVFFGAVFLWLKKGWKPVHKALLMIYTAIGFTALVIQGSESGLAALGVVMLLMFCLSVKDAEKMFVFWQEMTLLWGGCLLVFAVRLLAPGRMNYTESLADKFTYGWLPIIMTSVSMFLLAAIWHRRREKYPEKIFRIAMHIAVWGTVVTIVSVMLLAAVNTVRPGSIGGLSEYSLFTFDENWGSSRGATWSVGWKCFAEQDLLHKFVGVGPDCMPEYLYGGAGEELQAAVQEKFGILRLTNAHNEWLTILVNTGIFGLIGYAGMMICGIRRMLQRGGENPFACACGFCLLGYTVNNIFSFQQAMSTGTAFVIFGMGMAFLRRNQQADSSESFADCLHRRGLHV